MYQHGTGVEALNVREYVRTKDGDGAGSTAISSTIGELVTQVVGFGRLSHSLVVGAHVA